MSAEADLEAAFAELIRGALSDYRVRGVPDGASNYLAKQLASAFCPIVALLDGTIMSEDWEPLYAWPHVVGYVCLHQMQKDRL